jgi:hypothetical protein
MKPPIPIHDVRYVYIPSASHSDVSAFALRQRERMKAAQPMACNPTQENKLQAVVRPIQRKAK